MVSLLFCELLKCSLEAHFSMNPTTINIVKEVTLFSSSDVMCRLVAVNGKLVVLGGWNPTTWETLRTVFIYSFSSQLWTKGADMPSTRSFFACGALDNHILVAGGHDNSKTALASAEFYSLENDKWGTLPSMSDERDESTGVTMDGKFYVVSGYSTSTQGQFVKSAEVYNPTTDAWTKLEDMWTIESQSSSPGPFAVMFGKLYTFNGQNLCCYATSNNSWSVVDSLPEGKVNPICVTSVNESLVLTGPARNSEDQCYGTFVYKPVATTVAKRCKSEWEMVERDGGFVGAVQASYALEI